MQRWGMVLAAAIVGLVLAIVLISAPDTGGTVKRPAPRPLPSPVASALPPDEVAPAEAVRPPGPIGRPGGNGDFERLQAMGTPIDGPNPLAAEMQRRRDTPSAKVANNQLGPWAVIRRKLKESEDESADGVAEEIASLLSDLRQLRRDPPAYNYEDFIVRMKDIDAKVQSSVVGSEPDIGQMLEQIRNNNAEYYELLKNPEPAADGALTPGLAPP